MAKWNPPEHIKAATEAFKKRRRKVRKAIAALVEERKEEADFLLFHNRKPPRNRTLMRYYTNTEEGRALVASMYEAHTKETDNELEEV